MWYDGDQRPANGESQLGHLRLNLCAVDSNLDPFGIAMDPIFGIDDLRAEL